ncbi:MAG: hypothetical protein AAF558_01240 [Verrucomicrobiota bacterium]
MKKNIVVSIVVCVLLSMQMVHAEGANGDKKKKLSSEERKAKKEERFQQMSQDLGLTAEQQSIFKGQFEKNRTAIEGIRSNDSLSREEKREQIKSVKDSGRTSLESYLTPDQVSKWNAIREEQKAKKQERMEQRKEKRQEKKGDSVTS